ncbi:Uncharacterized protein TCM_042078 [Theobroma cacao]|uniref:Uncharacterized protein n=1 Tax=Theobroma cacao TaxID=3641 RepID=A0A061GY47_THECC|nr:Uncharacterized protein TCM_042078 [Theobroma cacao]
MQQTHTCKSLDLTHVEMAKNMDHNLSRKIIKPLIEQIFLPLPWSKPYKAPQVKSTLSNPFLQDQLH